MKEKKEIKFKNEKEKMSKKSIRNNWMNAEISNNGKAISGTSIKSPN